LETCTNKIECKVANIYEENNYDRWVRSISPIDLSIENIDDIVIHQTKISRKEFYKWLGKNSYLVDKGESYTTQSSNIRHGHSTYTNVSNQPLTALPLHLHSM